jgi:hypothetical protein
MFLKSECENTSISTNREKSALKPTAMENSKMNKLQITLRVIVGEIEYVLDNLCRAGDVPASESPLVGMPHGCGKNITG